MLPSASPTHSVSPFHSLDCEAKISTFQSPIFTALFFSYIGFPPLGAPVKTETSPPSTLNISSPNPPRFLRRRCHAKLQGKQSWAVWGRKDYGLNRADQVSLCSRPSSFLQSDVFSTMWRAMRPPIKTLFSINFPTLSICPPTAPCLPLSPTSIVIQRLCNRHAGLPLVSLPIHSPLTPLHSCETRTFRFLILIRVNPSFVILLNQGEINLPTRSVH